MATRVRTLRVDDELWDDALAAAEILETDLSAVMRRSLERLVRRAEKLEESK